MRLLSVSSQVVLGHVGNSALALPLARLGVELLAVPTVLFSNHPGYGAFDGAPLDGELLARLLNGLEARGLPEGLDGLLSGYLGTAETATLLAERLVRWRARRPDLPYLLDPVMGDGPPGEAGRLYVVPELPRRIARELLPLADWVKLNAFELSVLAAGRPATEAGELVEQARRLLRGRCRAVLVTSYGEGERVGALLVAPDRAWRLLGPRLEFERAPNGAGDLLAGLWLAKLLAPGGDAGGNPGGDPLRAAQDALGLLLGVLRETRRQEGVELGGRELALLQAQDRLAIGEENGVAVLPFG